MSHFHSDYKQQLLAAADALFSPAEAGPASQLRTRRRLPIFAVIAIGALLLAAAAFAANQIIGVGTPVKLSHHSGRSSPSTGIGVPVPGSRSRHRSARLLAISVPDPAGGLPWGMRTVTTTRGLVCLQIGRLLNGRLGVLGRDGQFKDDGLFHELPPGALNRSMCSQPNVVALYRVSGLSTAGALPEEVMPCSLASPARAASSSPPSCPVSDERAIAFGVLGPRALSVSYQAANRLHTVATSGGQGAYLIVLPQHPGPTPANEDFSATNLEPSEQIPVAAARGYLLSTIVFRFGARRCQTGPEHQLGGPPTCPASTSAPVLSPPAVKGLRSRVTLVVRKRAGGYALDLTFIAPVAVHDATTAYGVEYTMQGNPPCESGGAGQPIERDIERGQRVHVTLPVNRTPGCRGVIHGRIVLGRQGGALVGPTYDDSTVGRFMFHLP